MKRRRTSQKSTPKAGEIASRLPSLEHLIQAQRMEAVGQLAGGVAHDFNNLLSVINGYSNMLLEETSPGPAREWVEEIQKAGRRAAELTLQLLVFSRRGASQQRPLELKTLIAGFDSTFRTLVGEQIEYTLETSEEPVVARADSRQIEQVLLNLIVNAKDAMPKGGKLALRVANVELAGGDVADMNGLAAGKYALLEVIDTGMGISPETIRRIFEPFFTTKPKGGGTGLGLAVAYGIVKQHHGHIEVFSEPGRGATFRIYLPYCGETPEKTAESAPVAQSSGVGGTETILVVEDEERVRDYVARVLSRKGYHVIPARNGEDALDYLTTHSTEKIDLVLTDMVMPKMTGFELAAALRGRGIRIPILGVSGYYEEVHGEAGSAGFTILQKPVSPQVLLKNVRALLDAEKA
ncbi:MAG: response regulator [Verrucomicrobiae bacterium]|nr:response regulator [Verrucomicrobiae bacterium]